MIIEGTVQFRHSTVFCLIVLSSVWKHMGGAEPSGGDQRFGPEHLHQLSYALRSGRQHLRLCDQLVHQEERLEGSKQMGPVPGEVSQDKKYLSAKRSGAERH